MAGPGWLTGLLAAVMLTAAAYNATRLAAAARWGRAAELDADGVHVVMGVAMAGMLTPGLSFAPARLWQAVFAAAGAWFAWQFLRTRRGQALGPRRCPHPLPHLIECAAMVLMLALPAAVASAGATAATGMSGMSAVTGTAARFSPLTLLLALFMVGYVMWLGNNLTALAPARTTGTITTTGTAYLAPRCAACCKIAMGTTMGYMLVMML
ncbi:MAG TPA: DUF5134 domain-containing protein [Streptosporangiaceae bacterium]|nr:DUF5134 domain-containing protein [Streptosporangiaceae bacterium]HEX5296868.1 DUF5134 domain-containing protein [Streptosporangiaceae bacterium]